MLSLLYFYNVFSYSAIQPQVCNKLSVCSLFSVLLNIFSNCLYWTLWDVQSL